MSYPVHEFFEVVKTLLTARFHRNATFFSGEHWRYDESGLQPGLPTREHVLSGDTLEDIQVIATDAVKGLATDISRNIKSNVLKKAGGRRSLPNYDLVPNTATCYPTMKDNQFLSLPVNRPPVEVVSYHPSIHYIQHNSDEAQYVRLPNSLVVAITWSEREGKFRLHTALHIHVPDSYIFGTLYEGS